MKKLQYLTILMIAVLAACSPKKSETTSETKEATTKPAESTTGEWISLFDGKSFDGWKASENTETFKIEDGNIVVNGKRSHLYYVGDVNNGNFKNFELKCELMTFHNSNSGIYFHTEFQQDGWPSKGYEVQVNNTHSDWRKTGGLYAIQDVKDPPSKDNEWFTEHIIVKGKHVVVKVNGITTADYTEPENPEREDGMKGRLIGSGTFALQGHDPGSKVLYKSVMVKVLPD